MIGSAIYEFTGICTVMVSSLDAAPKVLALSPDAIKWKMGGQTMLDVTSVGYCEATDGEGQVLAAGRCFHLVAEKGDQIVLRRMTSRRRFTKDEIGAARKQIRVKVVNQERYDAGPFDFGSSYEDGSLSRVMASLDAIKASIPKQFRASACCEINSESGYENSHYASIEVSYSRPETDEEVVARLSEAEIAAEIAEAKERAQLAILKKKFGQ